MVKILVPLLLAAFQFGGPSILSTAGLMFLLVFFAVRINIFNGPNYLLLVGAFALLVPSFFYIFDQDYYSILARQIRIFMCYCLIFFASRCHVEKKSFYDLVNPILYYQAFCVFLCFIQYFALRNGWAKSVFVPYDFYGITAGDGDDQRSTTIPSYWIEFGADKGLSFGVEYFLRPTAFYSEPSYLGFMMLFCCSAIFFINDLEFNKKVLASILMAIIISVISESASAIISLAAVFGVYFFAGRLNSIVKIVVPLVFVFVIIISGVLDRLLSIGDTSGDISGFIRFVKPFYNIGKLLSDGKIFGNPQSRATEYFDPYFGGEYIGYGLDNGLLNIFIDMGLMSAVYFYAVYNFMPKKILHIYIVVLMINGNYLGFDRAVFVAILMIIFNSVDNRYSVKRS